MRDINDFTLGEQITGKTGTVFTLLSTAPYTRKDGTPSGILTWRAICARAGCGAHIDVTTGLVYEGQTKLSLKHCAAHRASPAEALKRGREVFKENCRLRRQEAKRAKAAAKERVALEKEIKRQALRDATAGLATDKRRKLSDEDVAEIRKLSAEGFSSGDLALVFPVSSSAIRNILGGRRRA